MGETEKAENMHKGEKKQKEMRKSGRWNDRKQEKGRSKTRHPADREMK